jgi:serine/threonine protein kinase
MEWLWNATSFGLWRSSSRDVHDGLIQPDIYRAPEVILGMSWTSKVDIWNVGALVSEERSFFFTALYAMR